MMKILANDGLSPVAIEMLKANQFEVTTDKIPQEELTAGIREFDALYVRSATKVTKEVIDAASNLKLIGRAGVGLDNINVEYAEQKGIKVINTPEASSISVAELTIAHLCSLSRFLYDSNREMPKKGSTDFKTLKKKYSKGAELTGKTLAIIGYGRIGAEVAKRAIGLGMHVLPSKRSGGKVDLTLDFNEQLNISPIQLSLQVADFDEAIRKADYISLHVPGEKDKALFGDTEFSKLKQGACLINMARGGVVDENALLKALDNGQLSAAALDVFINEPTPDSAVLNHPKIALSPHIGASTVEAQDRIGTELVEKTIAHFNTLSAN